jgi:hypothetical protein
MRGDLYMDKEIRAAIANRRLLKFMYDGCLRIVEPHDYGIHKGVAKLFCYQVGGQSRSGKLPEWRLFALSKMSDPDPTNQPFAGPRAVSGAHLVWDELFASVSRPPFRRRRAALKQKARSAFEAGLFV